MHYVLKREYWGKNEHWSTECRGCCSKAPGAPEGFSAHVTAIPTKPLEKCNPDSHQALLTRAVRSLCASRATTWVQVPWTWLSPQDAAGPGHPCHISQNLAATKGHSWAPAGLLLELALSSPWALGLVLGHYLGQGADEEMLPPEAELHPPADLV